MDEKIKKTIERIISICIIFILLFVTYYVSVNDVFNSSHMESDDEFVHNINLSVIANNWSTEYRFENTSNITAGGVLIQWAHMENISLSKKYWSGYNSYFIESIGNSSNGYENRYWQYYVNGAYANIGCTKYVLQDDDSITWKFEKSKW